MLMLALLALAGVTIVVQPAGPVRTLTQALALAHPGDRIEVRTGRYREPRIVVRVRVEIVGVGAPVFEGGAHTTLEIIADSVVVRGLRFEGSEPSSIEDRAAILVRNARGCRIESNEVIGAFFGIYAMQAADCVIARNRLLGPAGAAGTSGNGIHLWQSERMRVEENDIRGHRDGIYLEFVRGAEVDGNVVTRNHRYGLHFMRSDSCAYSGNQFADNGAGVAVMYSRGVTMTDNRFERNRGTSSYGLLLKEISDGTVRYNRFSFNTVALYLEDSNRNQVTGNLFQGNGTAIKVLANASDNRFEGNTFSGNSFDVATNSRTASSTFAGNWWDHYRGYDLDRDGIGDVPFRPVRLFSLVVEQHEPALILLRSPFVGLLDMAERLLPILTPDALSDLRPLMVRPR
jgi:nitrous oxidase accessory protein